MLAWYQPHISRNHAVEQTNGWVRLISRPQVRVPITGNCIDRCASTGGDCYNFHSLPGEVTAQILHGSLTLSGCCCKNNAGSKQVAKDLVWQRNWGSRCTFRSSTAHRALQIPPSLGQARPCRDHSSQLTLEHGICGSATRGSHLLCAKKKKVSSPGPLGKLPRQPLGWTKLGLPFNCGA